MSVREQIKLKNESDAKNKEKLLRDNFESYKRNKLNECVSTIANIKKTIDKRIEQLNGILIKYNNANSGKVRSRKTSKPKFNRRIFVVSAVVGLITGCTVTRMHYGGGIAGVIAGALIYTIIYFARIYSGKRKKTSFRSRKDKIQSEIKALEKQERDESKKIKETAEGEIKQEALRCKEEINKIRENTAAKTKKEIAVYEQEVDKSFKQFMNEQQQLLPIAQRVVEVFNSIDYTPEREPVIKLDLNFEISKTRIIFNPDNQNPESLEFYRQGFRALNNDSECEGLAKAVAVLTGTEMVKTTPIMIVSFDQVDAKITLHTKRINPNGRLL